MTKTLLCEAPTVGSVYTTLDGMPVGACCCGRRDDGRSIALEDAPGWQGNGFLGSGPAAAATSRLGGGEPQGRLRVGLPTAPARTRRNAPGVLASVSAFGFVSLTPPLPSRW